MSYYFLKNTAKSVRQMFPKVILEDLKRFPIKQISPEAQAPFIKLVDEILALKKQGENTSVEENKIDEMVFDLYELTDAERQIVESAA